VQKRFSVALGFLFLIAAGALFLASPVARNANVWGDVTTSLFTAFSSVCVTGLTVVDIAAEYSRAGQIAILILVEIGCLGLMTCGTFILIAVGRRLSIGREFYLMNAYGVAEVKGIKGLICWVVGAMLTIEIIGAFLYWLLLDDAYLACFYSIMSFCNAGFSILPSSLASFGDSPALLFLSGGLTVLGGIGFLVIYNLCTFKLLRKNHSAGRLSLHTKVVLRVTAILLLVAFFFFLLSEWTGALKDFPFWKKLTVGFYQAITPRTCGFCVTPTESLRPVTRLFYGILMFIGGAPGSAAAGIKVTTAAVLFYTLTAMCRGENETVITKRVIPVEIVREAIVIVMALVTFALLIAGILFVTESGRQISSDALFFEAVSAITTTGLSVGDTTASLSTAGKIVVMCAMFIGRLGALTVVMMIGDRESNRVIRFPSEEIVVG
jgi:trk system potassium uptake protein TrkH